MKNAGARPIIVGGWVRDRLLNLPSSATKDIDIEVFHISFEQLCHIFQDEPHITFPKFGVLRLNYADVSLPRIEHCTGLKYNDFCVQIQSDLSFEEASHRRDFTVNAIGCDPFSGEILDPFCGVNDLKNKCLKPISKAFMEDSYRILRAAQLIARFGFTPDVQLLAFGKCMPYENLSKKHIQTTHLILNSAPYKGKALQFLQDIQWVQIIDTLKE